MILNTESKKPTRRKMATQSSHVDEFCATVPTHKSYNCYTQPCYRSYGSSADCRYAYAGVYYRIPAKSITAAHPSMPLMRFVGFLRGI